MFCFSCCMNIFNHFTFVLKKSFFGFYSRLKVESRSFFVKKNLNVCDSVKYSFLFIFPFCCKAEQLTKLVVWI